VKWAKTVTVFPTLMTPTVSARAEGQMGTGGPLELTILVFLSATVFLSAWHFVAQFIN
jgi:hypothetical protein